MSAVEDQLLASISANVMEIAQLCADGAVSTDALNGCTVPPAFLCPITHLLMEWPVFTSAGTTYEHVAISCHLERKDTDPLTNQRLPNKTLVQNVLLRSQIQEWIDQHPSDAAALRNFEATNQPGPSDAANSTEKAMARLDQILRFTGTGKKSSRQERVAHVPEPLWLQGRKYCFQRCRGTGVLQVKNEGFSGWIDMPQGTNTLFATPAGIIFFDQYEIHEALVADTEGTEAAVAQGHAFRAVFAQPCKFGAKCTNKSCAYAHPFVCSYGVTCRKRGTTCKFLHPDDDSVVPLGKEWPLNQDCKYGPTCSNKTCHFAHTRGRMAIKRRQKKLFMTHACDLQPLDVPQPLNFGNLPQGATKFSFQGEFVFFFKPFPGAWAKEQHFQTCTVHRLSPKTLTYKLLMDYSLEGHYCNVAVGVGRYFVLSWWPYEEEAMRAIHEAVQRERGMENAFRQELKSKDQQIQTQEKAFRQELQSKEQQIQSQENALRQKDSYISQIKQKMQEDRKAMREKEMRWHEQRRRETQRRNERFRLRDPIHVYALQEGRDGNSPDDWILAIDYHKGAHGLQLEPPMDASGAQRLCVTEHRTIFEFELRAPADLLGMGAGALPVCPEQMCDGF